MKLNTSRKMQALRSATWWLYVAKIHRDNGNRLPMRRSALCFRRQATMLLDSPRKADKTWERLTKMLDQPSA